MHELSRLLWGSYGASIPKGDKIITKYLEEKARIINEPIKESFRDWDERLEWLRGILGLSESQENKPMTATEKMNSIWSKPIEPSKCGCEAFMYSSASLIGFIEGYISVMCLRSDIPEDVKKVTKELSERIKNECF